MTLADLLPHERCRRRETHEPHSHDVDGLPGWCNGAELPVSSSDVCLLTGISYRQLDYWVQMKILKPEGGKGSGDPRRWSQDQVDRVWRIKKLLDFGFNLEAAVRILDDPAILQWLFSEFTKPFFGNGARP